ncbi:Mediator of RNA polymerase II transcription subunit 34 [Vitis vinifera]|uniref:DNA 3'-5' helicase n=1 Tax=Vitis vinifera TaxID=29760 RepID=A0A438IZL1_VITVI|nr:Mediator of RNA polymerase II transcription subunit 34 [Vitis vinifera]
MVARWGIGMDEMSGDHKGWLIMSFNKPALERFNVEAVLVAFLESLTRASSLGATVASLSLDASMEGLGELIKRQDTLTNRLPYFAFRGVPLSVLQLNWIAVAKELRERGISADYYHADMDVNARERVHLRWSNSKLQVIVGTVAFGMGINKPDASTSKVWGNLFSIGGMRLRSARFVEEILLIWMLPPPLRHGYEPLLEGLRLAKAEGLSNLLKEGNSAVVLSCVNKERDSWRFDGWHHLKYGESGRAGRDGLPSECLLYFRPGDVPRQSSMVFYENSGLQNLYDIVQYCQFLLMWCWTGGLSLAIWLPVSNAPFGL